MTVPSARPGDRLRVRAGDWNAMALAAMRVEGMGPSLGGPSPALLAATPVVALARNTTATAIDRFRVAVLAAPAILPSDNEDEWAMRLAVGCSPATAADASSWLGVVTEPVRASGFGRVVVGGVAQAKVNVLDAAHRHATARAGDTHLRSAKAGQAAILWKESGTGVRRALVWIGPPTPPASGVLAATITAVSGPLNATYTAVACDDPDIAVTGAPVNRPLDPDHFDWKAAAVGDPCLIWQCVSDAGAVTRKLIALTEVADDQACPGGA